MSAKLECRIWSLPFISLLFFQVIAFATTPALPVKLDLQAIYTGSNQVQITASVTSLKDMQVEVELNIPKEMTGYADNTTWSETLTANRKEQQIYSGLYVDLNRYYLIGLCT